MGGREGEGDFKSNRGYLAFQDRTSTVCLNQPQGRHIYSQVESLAQGQKIEIKLV